MTDKLSQAVATSISTNSQVEISRTNFMDITVTSTGNRWVDPLTPRLLSLLRSRRDLSPYPYNGKPITTVSYEVYGTTSAWETILYLNGFQHPDEIPNGSILQIPSTQLVQDAKELNDYKKSTRGTIVIT